MNFKKRTVGRSQLDILERRTKVKVRMEKKRKVLIVFQRDQRTPREKIGKESNQGYFTVYMLLS